MNGRKVPLGIGHPMPRTCETIASVPLAVFSNSDELELLQLATQLNNFTVPIILVDRVEELFPKPPGIMRHVRPPFQKVWLDFSEIQAGKRFGALVETVDATTLQHQLKNSTPTIYPTSMTDKLTPKLDSMLSRSFGDGDLGVRFRFYVSLRVQTQSFYVTLGPIYEICHFIDSDGTVLSWPCFMVSEIPGTLKHIYTKLKESEKEVLCNNVTMMCMRSLYAFSLMGCSNVSVSQQATDEYLDDTATPIKRKTRQRVKLPFHVLKITAGNREITIGGRGSIPRNLPLHHVRGHYRIYHIGPMIDGKVNPATERRFVLDFMRGNPEHGVSNKIYEVSSTT